MQIGPYTIERELGRGGMGAVYLGRQAGTGVGVAVKVIHANLAQDPDLLARFEREGAVLARLNHPNLVALRDRGTLPGGLWLAMDYVPGETLEARLKARGPWPSHAAGDLILALSEGIAAAHRAGSLHRDLKPANVLLRAPNDHPLIVDFGLALPLDQSQHLTGTGEILGSPGYLAPEQCGTGEGPTPATDVYGLGAILYHVLTGQPPLLGTTVLGTIDKVINEAPRPPSQLVPGLDPGLEAICLRCLAKNPAERFGDAIELAEALREQPEPKVKRSSLAWGLGFLALAAGALAAEILIAEEAPSTSPAGTPTLSPSATKDQPQPPQPSPSPSTLQAERAKISAALERRAWGEAQGVLGNSPSLEASWLRWTILDHELSLRLGTDAAWLSARAKALSLAKQALADSPPRQRASARGVVALLRSLRDPFGNSSLSEAQLLVLANDLADALASPDAGPRMREPILGALAQVRARQASLLDLEPAFDIARRAIKLWKDAGAPKWRVLLTAAMTEVVSRKNARASRLLDALDFDPDANAEARLAGLYLRSLIDAGSECSVPGELILYRSLLESPHTPPSIKVRAAVHVAAAELRSWRPRAESAASALEALDQAPESVGSGASLKGTLAAARTAALVRAGRFAEAISEVDFPLSDEQAFRRLIWGALAELSLGKRPDLTQLLPYATRPLISLDRIGLLEIGVLSGEDEFFAKIEAASGSASLHAWRAIRTLNAALEARAPDGSLLAKRPASTKIILERLSRVLLRDPNLAVQEHLDLGLWREALAFLSEFSEGRTAGASPRIAPDLALRLAWRALAVGLDEVVPSDAVWESNHERFLALGREALDQSTTKGKAPVAILVALVETDPARVRRLRALLLEAMKAGEPEAEILLGYQHLVEDQRRAGHFDAELEFEARRAFRKRRAWDLTPAEARLALSRLDTGESTRDLLVDARKLTERPRMLDQIDLAGFQLLLSLRDRPPAEVAAQISLVTAARRLLKRTRLRALLDMAEAYLSVPGQGREALATLDRLQAWCGEPPRGEAGRFALARSRALRELDRPDRALAQKAVALLKEESSAPRERVALAEAHLGRLQAEEVASSSPERKQAITRCLEAMRVAPSDLGWLETARARSGSQQAAAYLEALRLPLTLEATRAVAAEAAAAGHDPLELCWDALNVTDTRSGLPLRLGTAAFQIDPGPRGALTYARAVLVASMGFPTGLERHSPETMARFAAASALVEGPEKAVLAGQVELFRLRARLLREGGSLTSVKDTEVAISALRAAAALVPTARADELCVAEAVTETLLLVLDRVSPEGTQLVAQQLLATIDEWSRRPSAPPRAWLWKAKVLVAQSKQEAAVAVLQEGLALPQAASRNVRAPLEFDCARLLSVLGQDEEALSYLELVCKHADHYLQKARALLLRGDIFLRQGKFRAAAEAYIGVLVITPGRVTHERVRANLGVLRAQIHLGSQLEVTLQGLNALAREVEGVGGTTAAQLRIELDLARAQAYRAAGKASEAFGYAKRARKAAERLATQRGEGVIKRILAEAGLEWLEAQALGGVAERAQAAKAARRTAENVGLSPRDRDRFRALADRLAKGP